MHEVAVIGIGVVSSLGCGVERVSRALQEGRSGVRLDAERKELGFRSCLTGAIDDFVRPELSRKEMRTMPEFALWSYAAAREALAMAGWSDEEVRHPLTGLLIGNDSTIRDAVEQVETVKREASTFPLGGAAVFRALNSTVSMNLDSLLGCQGASWTMSGACASGSHSVGLGAELIASGRQERMICGGTQEITWESVASFDATNAFSTRHDDPQAASRPFDASRDGLVPSGGAAMVALERMDLARRRGAPVLGRIAAWGFASDGGSLAAPTGTGLRLAVTDCARRAGVSPDEVDYVSCHATSTPLGDMAEARVVTEFFGAHRPWVSSVKSMTEGHEMWMAGASQVVYSLLMMRDGFIAPNINFERQDEDAPSLRIAAETIDLRPDRILCNAAGFGGTNSCLLLETARAGR